ncbi:hypothetical protein [Glaciimonas immobilis]|uniref:Uncharacterized protein n=1 Tax=Glaciimonas immobilis TaxID=728004 RepID=A0A840RUN6_9BURK|nr:hypothetical protein [Glaciimonas immobilis]KAF3996238.1 hypothetical protein HAV38_19635 [Glaciimonas immobilis]MBB5202307.1 hypothetical protein [Glaciimonas immobilis]
MATLNVVSSMFHLNASKTQWRNNKRIADRSRLSRFENPILIKMEVEYGA